MYSFNKTHILCLNCVELAYIVKSWWIATACPIKVLLLSRHYHNIYSLTFTWRIRNSTVSKRSHLRSLFIFYTQKSDKGDPIKLNNHFHDASEWQLWLWRCTMTSHGDKKGWMTIKSLTLICCWWLIWPIYKMMQNNWKMIESLAHRCSSSESSQRELSNEYQHDRV